MSYEYLKRLSLSEELEAKLRSLGARSASSLLSMMEHAPEKFSGFIGEAEAQRIRTLLPDLVPEEEKQQLANLPEFRGKFGAAMPGNSQSPDALKSTERRDALMRQIQMMRQSGVSSTEAQAKLADLEKQFRDELKSTVSPSS